MSDSRIDLLEKFIGYCSVKNRTISKNIANIGTENYKRQDVNFSDVFSDTVKNQLLTDNPKHIQITLVENSDYNNEIVNDKKTEGTSEVNNVNIEKEMSELAKNTLDYKFASRNIGNYYRAIQSAIKGGSSQ